MSHAEHWIPNHVVLSHRATFTQIDYANKRQQAINHLGTRYLLASARVRITPRPQDNSHATP